jgi:hypothetical protein
MTSVTTMQNEYQMVFGEAEGFSFLAATGYNSTRVEIFQWDLETSTFAQSQIIQASIDQPIADIRFLKMGDNLFLIVTCPTLSTGTLIYMANASGDFYLFQTLPTGNRTFTVEFSDGHYWYLVRWSWSQVSTLTLQDIFRWNADTNRFELRNITILPIQAQLVTSVDTFYSGSEVFLATGYADNTFRISKWTAGSFFRPVQEFALGGGDLKFFNGIPNKLLLASIQTNYGVNLFQANAIPVPPPAPGGLSKGAIVGIVIGSVVGAILLATGVSYAYRRRQDQRYEQLP